MGFTSRPRKTSPRESARVLPCSVVTDMASLSMSRRMSSWSLSMIRCRAVMGVFFHVLKACLAAATADSNSTWVVRGMRLTTSWVAGLITSMCWEA